MKRIFTILFSIALLMILPACKTTTECVDTHTHIIVIQDTVDLHAIHWHYETMEGDKRCAYVASNRIPFTDTLRIELLSDEKKN